MIGHTTTIVIVSDIYISWLHSPPANARPCTYISAKYIYIYIYEVT